MGASAWLRPTIVAVPVLVAGLVGGYFLGHGAEGSAQPGASEQFSIGFSPAVLDLGRHPWHSEIPFTVQFVNRQPTSVTISSLEASCGCTDLQKETFAGREIAAGEVLEVSGNISAGVGVGPRVAEVHLLLESGAIYSANLHYEVYPTYRVSPDRIEFERVDLEAPEDLSDAVAELHFYSDDARPKGPPDTLQIPWLDAAWRQVDEGHFVCMMQVDKRKLPFGRSRGVVAITTTDPHRPKFLVPVFARATANLRVVPSHVILKEGQDARVAVVNEAGEGVDVSEIVGDTTGLEIHRLRDQGVFKLRIQAMKRVRASDAPYELVVKTDEGGSAQFSVIVVPDTSVFPAEEKEQLR